MSDGRRFDQALRALDKLIAEQQRAEQLPPAEQPVQVAPTPQRI